MIKLRNKSRGLKVGDYQPLEPKRLLAGDVQVFAQGSLLFVRGDHVDNQIQISVTEYGDVQVQGTGGTKINGDDSAFVLDTQNGQISGLRANMGRGDDALFVEGLDIQGRSVVYGGLGDDSVGFYQTNVTDDFFAQTFHGDDSVSLDEVNIGDRLALFTLNGEDNIAIEKTNIGGATFIVTGNGDDNLALRDTVHGKSAYLLTQNGNDFVGTDNLRAKSFVSLATGFGSDDVFVKNSNFEGHTLVGGGFRSQDNLELNGENSFAESPRVFGFEGDDVAGGLLQLDNTYLDLVRSGTRLGTIAELATITPELSTLLGALQATGLDAAVAGAGPLTVFAPLNSAFDKISGVVSSLSVEQLTDVLTFHVVAGDVSASQLATLDRVDTLLGQSFTVDTTSGVVLNGNATLAATDIRAKNGVVHLLNDVLVPGADMAT
jgi:uncharacterized surface protein with fasciclin (FAS1) repeats